MRENQGIVIEASEWPLVIVTYTTFTKEEHLAHFQRLRDMFLESPDGPFVVMADLRKAQSLDAEQRRRTVEFWKEVTPLVKERFIALAYVADNALIRGVIQAVSWFQKPPAPMRTVANVDEAKAWLQTRIAAHLEEVDVAANK